MGYILSIDQSTSGTKATLWRLDGTLVLRRDLPHRQITNDLGWLEHDPVEIYGNVRAAAAAVIRDSGILPGDIIAMGISNQRETALCWDRNTGAPVYNAIVWQCGRATDVVEAVQEQGMEQTVLERTGIPLCPFFSAAKLGWILRHVPEAAQKLQQNALCFGTVDSWLVFCLTKGSSYKTDYSNASRTQLLDLDKLCWSEEIAAAFGIPADALPEICHSDSLFGYTDIDGLLPNKIPIHGVLGDSHAALFANGCISPYTAKATLGTGSSVMMNVGKQRPAASNGIVTSLAWGLDDSVEYVLEGNINFAGSVTKWLERDLGLVDSVKQVQTIAESVPNTGGVYLVPAFSGLGAPYFNNNARAALLGMNISTRKAHVVRAAEECIAYQIKDVVEAINSSIPDQMSVLRTDGGPTKDGFLMQFLADQLQIPIEMSCTEELSAAGAAYAAAIGCGVSSREEIFSHRQAAKRAPVMDKSESDKLYAGWKNAVSQIDR